MSTKHTQGPWRATIEGTPGIDFTASVLGDKYLVARIFASNDDTPEHEELETNARLIAAAPELLEALKEALSCIDQHTDDLVVGPIIEMAQKAIAKAEGGDS